MAGMSSCEGDKQTQRLHRIVGAEAFGGVHGSAVLGAADSRAGRVLQETTHHEAARTGGLPGPILMPVALIAHRTQSRHVHLQT
jgi:hypothetical protein